MLGIADSIIGVAGKVLDKFIEDKDLKTKLDFELHGIRDEINELEARSLQNVVTKQSKR